MKRCRGFFCPVPVWHPMPAGAGNTACSSVPCMPVVGNASPKGEQIQKSRSQRLQEKSNGWNRMDAFFASLRPESRGWQLFHLFWKKRRFYPCRACQDARLAKTVVVSAKRKSAPTVIGTRDIVRIRAGTFGTHGTDEHAGLPAPAGTGCYS